jgi:hypothetical protein
MSGLYTDNKAAQVGITMSFSILVTTDIIGNTLVILIVLTNKTMKSPMNYLLLNLAVADMMVGVFIAPQYIFSQLFTLPNGLTGTVICKLLTGGTLAWIGLMCCVCYISSRCFRREILCCCASFLHKVETKHAKS